MISKGRDNTYTKTYSKDREDTYEHPWDSPYYRKGAPWLDKLKKTDFKKWYRWWKTYENGRDIPVNSNFDDQLLMI